ncbi:Fusaric acid resistance protein-like-domain-containing protein, partial [Thelephora terrestris]
RWYSRWKPPSLSPLHRKILKCAVAYFIGSLFTFNPTLSGLITSVISTGDESAPSQSGHMVATVTVYFNPAKTIGGMFEADKYCLLGVLFAGLISLSSMSTYWTLEEYEGLDWLADTLALLLIGIGICALAWTKSWMNRPSFNTACSMTSIILFIVVVREGGLETLLQVSFIILIGSIISNVVCFSLWSQTATKNLQDDMRKNLDSFSTLLSTLVCSFLLEEPPTKSREKLQRAVQNHQTSFTSLKSNLSDAKTEMTSNHASPFDLPKAYEDAVGSMNRLAQHLNGLRSGSNFQYDITKKYYTLQDKSRTGPALVAVPMVTQTNKGKAPATPIGTAEETQLLDAAVDIFGDIVGELGPPLKALSNICITSLKKMKRDDLKAEEFDQLMEDVERALFTFDSTSNQAVVRLYSRRISCSDSYHSLESSIGDNPLLTSGTKHENVFLAYFFIFTLQEFAAELTLLVDAMSRVAACWRAAATRGNWFKRRIRDIELFFRSKVQSWKRQLSAPEKRRRVVRRLSSFVLQNDNGPSRPQVHFPKILPHAPNTVLTPKWSTLSLWGRIKQSLWVIGGRLKEPDVKYAVKVGMATAVLAAPAFIRTTRPIFTEYRGEWALISFFVVMSPTIGGTNFLSVHRILGTLLGAFTAAGIWAAFPESPVILSIFGFFFSIPCFYYIVSKPTYATSARFVLLAYNLVCLYSYNIRDQDEDVIKLALHRSISVTAGVVWAGIVCRYWWPTEARRELSRALGEFCLNIGWLYTRLVAFNSAGDDINSFFDEDEASTQTPTPIPTLMETSTLLRRNKIRMSHSIQNFMSMELHLQLQLIELQKLLAQTQHEPRLKGPFPTQLYRSVLTTLQSILDKLHSMRCVTAREEWHTTVRRDFILPVNRERREMVGNIILYFSVLSSAFRLKAPLPPYLPPAAESQQRLVDAIRNLDVVKNRDVKASRQLLFFAYALTMKGVIQDLDFLGRTVQEAFGVIGEGLEEFEELFTVETRHIDSVS